MLKIQKIPSKGGSFATEKASGSQLCGEYEHRKKGIEKGGKNKKTEHIITSGLCS
jgi:hypothetical protein